MIFVSRYRMAAREGAELCQESQRKSRGATSRGCHTKTDYATLLDDHTFLHCNYGKSQSCSANDDKWLFFEQGHKKFMSTLKSTHVYASTRRKNSKPCAAEYPTSTFNLTTYAIYDPIVQVSVSCR